MSTVVTSRDLLDDVRFARDAMQQASEWARQAAADLPRAETDYEDAYAKAFIKFKAEGDTDALAKQRALLHTSNERQRFSELKENLRVAKAELHSWGACFEAYRTIGFTATQEMKLV